MPLPPYGNQGQLPPPPGLPRWGGGYDPSQGDLGSLTPKPFPSPGGPSNPQIPTENPIYPQMQSTRFPGY
jgi:hypothetical protein